MLDAFFEPRSVAIIGATPKPRKPGYIILTNMKTRFKGKLYAVNPKYKNVLGVPCFPSILDVSDEVDLAIVVVPNRVVEKVIDDVIKKDVKAVIIITAGFSEIGNKELEERVKERLREHGIRAIGPNCLGVYYYPGGVDTFFFREPGTPRPPPSDLAIISQSGALAASIMDTAASRGIGIGAAISLGNRIDVGEAELLPYLRSKGFKSFLLYIEGLRDGEGKSFLEALSLISDSKVLIYKGGRTKVSQRATASHTASVAGSYKVFKDVVEEFGGAVAEDPGEIMAFASAVQYMDIPKGNKLLVVTDAGGVGVQLADALGDLYDMPKPLSKELEVQLPPHVRPNNPMDVGGDADDARYELVLKTLSKRYDLVIVAALLESPGTTPYIADIVKEVQEETGVPHLLLSSGGKYSEVLELRARELGLGFAKGVEEAIAAAKVLWRIRKTKEILAKRLRCQKAISV
ncbi:CoA-binding protein [Ignicoccus pacificus DSM 13166]|uniref:CoA-binding protein n=1 Tax=Ignicoccus pacificus DSM 13166 TaxID=940294 RepID=A0A977KA46_9CREN|nr:CoA-binding protein [Ignicoccus pacificus DSM 13166]